MVNAEFSALRYHVIVCSKGREYRPNVAQVLVVKLHLRSSGML